MKRLSPISLGILLGLAFTIILNASNIFTWTQHRLNVADLGAEIGSADEVYYFALIQDVRDGHPHLGNASLFEYKNAPAVAGFALLPQGILARYTSLTLPMVILLGDVIFPLLACCLAFLVFRRFLDSEIFAALLALAFMCSWSTGWQRSMHPQVTMPVFLLTLLTFVSDSEGKKMYPRGACLFLLLLVQPIFGFFMLTAESVDALLHWKLSRKLQDVIRRRWPLLVYTLAAGLLHFGLQRGADPSILAETYRRRGLILSHLPTAPVTQLFLAGLLAISVWILWSKRATSSARVLPILLVSGLIVLNQSILHGHDAVFGLYYRYPLSFIVWLAAGWAAVRLVPRRFLAVIFVLLLAYEGLSMVQEIMTVSVPQATARSEELRNSDVLAVLQELSRHPTTEIVLAPIDISNLVPVLTPHYALFTQYAHFEFAPDRELAERYLLLKSFFAFPVVQIVEGDPIVFGIFAGNVYARNKILCRLHLTQKDCDKKLSDFIADQQVRKFVDAGVIDQLALLQRFGVSSVVTDKPLTEILRAHCKDPVHIGRYTIYSCNFRSENLNGI